MSQVISTRLPNHTADRLKRLARRLGKTPSETGAMLIEEALREAEFAYLEFRHSSIGRQPYLKNSNLAVWQVIRIAQDYGMNREKVAAHFQQPLAWVQSTFNYAEAYPEEIANAISDAMTMNETALKRLLPQIEPVTIPKAILEGKKE